MTLQEQLQSALGPTYSLERELGGGGMSRVFVATETALGRTVVVKVVAPGLLEGISADRFTREVRLAARLQQANIVPLLSAGEANGLSYYTMPFVDGLSLRARLANGPPLTQPEAIHVLRDVAKALAYAHAQGVVHRDIKPENVLLSGGTAMVTDFGIAKALSASRTQGDGDEPIGITSTELTAAGSSLGTPAYMSPEQAVGSAVDLRADLYAWGIVAYELLAHAHPFAGRATMQQLVAAQIAETPAPLAMKNPAVPAGLSALVMQCLEKDPASRPASANELLAALDAAATPDSSRAARSAAPRTSSKRRIALVAGGVALLAIVGTLITLRLNRGSPASPNAKPSTVADRSIAVLPLANLSGDKTDDYFGIGLAEEMTRALSKTGVRVIGRVSAGALLAKGFDEQAIAKALGVGSLLTGSVQHAGNQVRINVSLLSAADGSVRWTERYDRPLTNVFAVQDEIARAVAENLLGSIGGGAKVGAARIETEDPQAYSLFLQGQVLFGRRTAETLKQAISAFEQAVARDPKFARAQASLALALAAIPSYLQGDVGDAIARTTAAAGRAIALDPTIAESYTALAYTDLMVGDARRADEHFRKSLALDSSVATTWGWYGLLANGVGDFAEAHRRIARGRELEPASLIARTWDTQVYIVEREYRIADSLASETIRLDSTFALIWLAKAEALLFEGRGAEAVAILERRVAELPPHQPSDTHAILAYAYAHTGMTAKARALLEEQRIDNGGRLPANGMLAAALEELGDHEAAIALLGEAVRRHDAWLLQYARGERYDKLRRDPRGAGLLGRVERM
jgi:serine/threonine-protein kinase